MHTALSGDGKANFTAEFAETDEEDKEIDCVQDHTKTYHFFGKAIRILYEYGWKFGCSNLVECKNWEIHQLFDDGFEDYLAPEEIDGGEVICV